MVSDNAGPPHSEIPLPESPKYLIVGVNPVLVNFVEAVLSGGVPAADVTVVTDRHRRPIDIDRLGGIRVVEVLVASEEELIRVVDEVRPTICCVFSWYALFSRRFIDRFKGLIFNMHVGELPVYRGAGGYSWQVLNNARSLGAYIHQLIPKVDAGPIICSEVATMSIRRPYPADFKRLAAALGEDIAIRFAHLLCTDSVLRGAIQDESAGEYYPKLATAQNGVIDFSWNVDDVDRFIRAFSDPYPGAGFSYRGSDFRVARCSLLAASLSRHPFCAGLIANRSDAGVHVLLRDGAIAFQDVYGVDGTPVDLSTFKIGDRFYSTAEAKLAAVLFRPRPVAS